MEYVYCGGRFAFDYHDVEFEKEAEKDYRAILLNDVNKLLRNSGTVILSSSRAYVGPYYFQTDDMMDLNIVEVEKRQIESCTVAVFLLDNSPCPGTIAEMVYAASLQKRIQIFYVIDERETESILSSPFWYPMILCIKIDPAKVNMTACNSFDEARVRILKWLGKLQL